MDTNEKKIRWLLEDKGRSGFQLRPGFAEACPELAEGMVLLHEGAFCIVKKFVGVASSRDKVAPGKALLIQSHMRIIY